MKQKSENTKSTVGIVSGVLSLILGGGSLVGFFVFLIVAVFAAIGLAGQKEGTEAWAEQNAIVSRYEIISYILGALAIVFVALGIVLLVISIRKKRQLKKQKINTEVK